MKTFLLLLLLSSFLFADLDIATVKVHSGHFPRINTPVSVSLDGVNLNQDNGIVRLFETTHGKRTEIPCQLQNGISKRLNWILADTTLAESTRIFEIVLGDTIQTVTPIKIFQDEKKLVLLKNESKVLQYNHATVYPPAGVDDIFKRSGFIHPLWSPAGEVLTRIQPDDHYHHYGIWGPWTKTTFEGRHVDFWNLAEGQGTVRFAGYISAIQGPVYSGFQAKQEHVDFSAKGEDKVALNEVFGVRVWAIENDNTWLWDFTSQLNCASSSPILLEAYRYGGGIGFRAVESWTKENVDVFTSAGKTRKDADGTKAMWCYVSGESEEGNRSGILFLSHPENREHPEPMRVWPENANGNRGDMFFEFCPIRHKSWKLIPGQDYVLKYRMLVYDGEIDPETAERFWRDFAYPPRAELIVK
jgi:hypothetical protein